MVSTYFDFSRNIILC